jgi:fatty acid desaturase
MLFLFKKYDICNSLKTEIMSMNKNTVLAWATTIMIIVGVGLIALGAFRYYEVAGYGFAAVGIGFFAIAWVFNALKGRM